MDITFICFR